jgi:hypothetical protein
MATDRRRIPAWQKHEEQVALLYRTLGYSVEPNINLAGKQADLVCRKWFPGTGEMTLYVECKYSDMKRGQSISNTAVDEFIASFLSRKDKLHLTAGVLVTNCPPTQYAKALVALHHDVFVKTLDDLYEDLFCIRQYLDSQLGLFRVSGASDDYIAVKATDPRSTRKRPAIDLLSAVNQWLRHPDNNQLLVLGDFGSGKTTFLKHLFCVKREEYLAGRSQRFPLFITLRDYGDIKDSNDLVLRILRNLLGSTASINDFLQVLSAGKTLLLLDGFDEMGIAADTKVRRYNYGKLSQLCQGLSKVVISCRPSYFVSSKELLSVFAQLKTQVSYLPPTGGKDAPAGSPLLNLALPVDLDSPLESLAGC